jgi:hypothetical protein
MFFYFHGFSIAKFAKMVLFLIRIKTASQNFAGGGGKYAAHNELNLPTPPRLEVFHYHVFLTIVVPKMN